MRAAVVHQLGGPPRWRTAPCPEPGPGEVIVRIEASGLCHTDIHAAHGDWPVKPTPPFVPGHEGVGRIEAVGAGRPDLRVGERVAVPWLGVACGVVRVLRVRLGDAVPEPAEHRLLDRRRLRRVRRGHAPRSSCRCPTASTRWTPRR